MPGKQIADVVFCLDASASMQPCFSALRTHIQNFVRGLESGGQINWDLRLDFLAYSAGSAGGGIFGFRSLFHNSDIIEGLYGKSKNQSSGRFFTSSIDEFCSGLDQLSASGDEASFIALDTALDFPWREAGMCHRVVVVLTDEALETGVLVKDQTSKISQLIEKLHALRVKLFIVGPESAAFDAICAADRSEYEMLDNTHDGLKNADFGKILGEIGKSVSVSNVQGEVVKIEVKRALFGQTGWVARGGSITGS